MATRATAETGTIAGDSTRINHEGDVHLTQQGYGGGSEPPDNGDEGQDPNGGNSPDYGRRLQRARMGLLIALAPILVLFLTFTVAYLLRHGLSGFDERARTYGLHWVRLVLPTRLLLVNTALLFASSITIELARRRNRSHLALSPVQSIPGISIGKERGFTLLVATALLGIAFLCGQVLAWRALSAGGFELSNTSSAFVYLLTAAHAVHLAGGVLILIHAIIIYFLQHPIESRHIVVDITAWYWHFMFLLWIYIFALLEWVR